VVSGPLPVFRRCAGRVRLPAVN